jgi:hypothetical protein
MEEDLGGRTADDRRCEISSVSDRIDPLSNPFDNTGCEYVMDGCWHAVDQLTSVRIPVVSVMI